MQKRRDGSALVALSVLSVLLAFPQTVVKQKGNLFF
jgi:hypothetical protein